ncbi:FKBP-type peptidyl-prolyl cis-trans isomerase [Pelagibaculum spongiae]|uniref:Peptidyl-prolyl cis-trans isomerase n=1 Tax=Pelagibaculum spongiae TaxID=2080658 RepID=A0A2V1GTG0_9GAMM|nr:peptidylprolyl isomerase [Pelagibaculum spongiae]PVZ66300.1 peptidylprolyl isomerase [Pelagibaculum spongiae]
MLLIGNNSVVSIDYKLTLESGEVVDQSPEGEPLVYLHGASNIIPGLEEALVGKTDGAELTVNVAPEKAYGERHEEGVQVVPREAFQGVDQIEPGMQFQAEGPQGPQMIMVVAIEGDEVTVDANHPLSGKTLTFEVKVLSVREATAEEIEHGHAH